MKFNWGTGIAIFYSCFVIVMVSMVILSAQNKVHLVQDNYYDKDLNYESFRQKRQNASQLADQITIQFLQSQRLIQVEFPKQMKKATGTLILFRPSNKFLDKKYNLQLNEKMQMNIPLDNTIRPGLWHVQIDWENEGVNYFKEETISL